MMIDVKGREIRIGKTKDDQPIDLKRNEIAMIRADGGGIPSSETCLQIDSSQAV